MTSDPAAACGLVLNNLYAPCHLPKLHDGSHESRPLTVRPSRILVRWRTPEALSAERQYLFEESERNP